MSRYQASPKPVALVRAFIILLIILVGSVSITIEQFFGIKLLSSQPELLQGLINLTKYQFIVLLVYVSSVVNPSQIIVTFDEAGAEKFSAYDDTLYSILAPNSVIISNHQIYTDWLFHWFLAYTANLGDSVFIILKDLSKIPILGYGMRNFNFLFLSRKWEKDKIVLTNQLLGIDANARGLGPSNNVKHVASSNIRTESVSSTDIHMWPEGSNPSKIWPYQLIIYPEGTVPSDHTKARSANYTTGKNLPPLKHTLLPRTRGLFLTLRKLRNSVEAVYDITTGYSDLKPGEYGEILFSLKRYYLLGKGPSQVNMHIKRWQIADIPLGAETLDVDEADPQDLENFEQWLIKVWYEKDELLDYFYTHGKFPQPTPDWKTVKADFKVRSVLHVIPTFFAIAIVLLLLRATWVILWKFV